MLALPLAAVVAAAEFGIAYAAYLVPGSFASAAVGMAGVSGLLGLLFFAAYLLEIEDEPGLLPSWWVLACSAAVLTGVFAAGLGQQAMHDRGRVERAIVVALRPSGESDVSYSETLTDLSGRPIPGMVSDDSLKVGDRITVTVDPKGMAPLHLGSRPPASRFWWTLAAVLAGLQAMTLVIMGMLSAVELAYGYRFKRLSASRSAHQERAGPAAG